MDRASLPNPKRYDDPLGDFMRDNKAAPKYDSASYPDVKETYRGFYAELEPLGKEGTAFLGSSEGMIGTEMALLKAEDGYGFFTHDGRCIAVLEKSLSDKLADLLEVSWTVHCVLAYTIYSYEEKAFSAQFACFCYSPKLSEEQKGALERFIQNMIDRMASATHPRLDLSQEQFVRVLESKGEWYLTKSDPWPQLPKGSIYYRRRRTFTDRLIHAARKGNTGCVVVSWVVLFIAAAAAAFAIWFFFFSG